MAINLNVNGIIYRYPETGDSLWGQAATQWAQACTNGMLQKAGGSFPLTSDVDFGGAKGVIASYYTARSSNPAQTGTLRLGHDDFIAYRNAANSADLPLSTNVSDQLTFNGSVLLTSSFSSLNNSNIASNAAIALSKLAATTASRALVSDASGIISASTVTSTTLGYLDATSSVQTQLNGKLSLTGGTMSGSLLLSGLPLSANEAATKQYVDNAMLGISPKSPARVATTIAGTLASSFQNGSTIDGETLATGDRILIKNQVAPAENGIYVVQASGAPVRSTDADTWTELLQAYAFITNGTINGGSAYLCNAVAGGTINVDPVNFFQFSGSVQYTTDGEGIEVTGTQFSLELDGTTLSKSASGLRLNTTVVSDIAAKLPNPLTTTGDLIYSSSGTTGTRLPIGTSGQILTVSGGIPSWQTFSLNPTVVSVSGNVVLSSTDSNKIYLVNTSASRSFTLPTPAAGLSFTIKDATGQAGTNPISLIRAATEQIEGIAATKTLQTNWGSWRIISDGTNWFIL